MRILRYRTAVITGAGSGIGRAVALEMSRHGMNLALVDINEDGLAQTRAMISDSKLTVSCHVLDVTDIQALNDLPQAVLGIHRTIDVLVNNAGVTCVKSFFEQSMDDFDWVMNVNFNAVVRGTKLFLPYLMRRPEAHIINISSIFGIVGVPGQTSYCASKFAVRGFSESLQEELINTPIGVTVVHPGGVATRVVADARTSDEALKKAWCALLSDMRFIPTKQHVASSKRCVKSDFVWYLPERRSLATSSNVCAQFGAIASLYGY